MGSFGTFEESLASYIRTDAEGHKVDKRAETANKLCKDVTPSDFIMMMSEVPCDVAAIFSCCLAVKAGSDKDFKRLSLLKGKPFQAAVKESKLLVTQSTCVPGALLYFEKLCDTAAGAKLYVSVAKELAAHKAHAPETEAAPETPSIHLPAEGLLFDAHPSDDDSNNNDNNASEEF